MEEFVGLAKPLHALAQKDCRFEYAWEYQAAFQRLKTSLTLPPVLGMPRDAGQFVLDSDASNLAIGVVILQQQDGVDGRIVYLSRKLSRAELN
jgi:RNase H-like domain found in reverse transcriptase